MIWASWWPALLGRELDVDGLFGAALFLFGEVDEGTLVGFGERRLQDAAGPQPAGAHDVDLGAVQDDLGAQEQPRHQSEHDGEEPVHRLGVLEVVADQVSADRLPTSSCPVGT